MAEFATHACIIRAYHANGNISLLTSLSQAYPIDNISYTYSGNKLISLTDYMGDDLSPYDYPGHSSFTYDNNGNMISDAAKGMVVSYNRYNLPQEINFASNKKIITFHCC